MPRNRGSHPSLKQQYGDLCEDDGDEEAESNDGASQVGNADDLETPAGAHQMEPMDGVDEVLAGSWFRANTPKRSRDQPDRVPSKKSKSDLPAYPVNKTRLSGSGCTVLVAQLPVSQDSLVGMDTKYFTQDPVILSTALKSVLNYDDVKEVRVNKRRNLVAIEFIQKASTCIDTLLSLTALGPYAVRFYRPSYEASEVSWGVIGPIHEDVSMDDLLASVRCEGFTVVTALRLFSFQGGSKKPSRAIKIGFQGKSLPRSLLVDIVSYPVRVFKQPPPRCYRCQRHGHMSGGCSAPLRCLVCGEEHSREDCHALAPRCANCGLGHIASSRDCVFNQEASAVRDLMASGMPFRTARSQVMQMRYIPSAAPAAVGAAASPPSSIPTQLPSQQSVALGPLESASGAVEPQPLRTMTVTADVHQSQGSYIIPRRYPREPVSYASAVSSSAGSTSIVGVPADNPSQFNESRIADQCESRVYRRCEETLLTKCQDLIESTVTSLFTKMSALLLELFSLNLHNEGKKERQVLLLGLIRNHFGDAISGPFLEKRQDTIELSGSASALQGSSTARSSRGGRKDTSAAAPSIDGGSTGKPSRGSSVLRGVRRLPNKKR